MNGIVKLFHQPLTIKDFHSAASEAKDNERTVVGEDKNGHLTLKNEKLGIIGSAMRKLGTFSLTKNWSIVANYNNKLNSQNANTLNHLLQALKNAYTQRGAYQMKSLRENGAVLERDSSSLQKIKAKFEGSDFQKNLILNLTTTAQNYEKVFIRPNVNVQDSHVRNKNHALQEMEINLPKSKIITETNNTIQNK